jgi:hypothetical protein
MMTVEEKINALPKEIREEVYDFIDFMMRKTDRDEKRWRMEITQKSIDKIWDNTEDDIYGELLKR